MGNLRLIARLDIKAPNLIKGIHLEGLRVIGDPNEYARRYYEAGADELSGAGDATGLHQRAGLYAEFGGEGLEGGFEDGGLEIGHGSERGGW